MLKTLQRRLRFVNRFARSARSLHDVPAACLLGLARGSPFNRANFTTSIARYLFPSLSLHPRRLDGGRVWINTADVGQLIAYEEILVDGCYDLGLVPFIPSVVIDCGAHIGLFTRLAAVRYPAAQLIAFEPNPDNCISLERQLAPLGDRVQLRAAAVSLADGERWFEVEESNAGRLTDQMSAKGWYVPVVDFRRELCCLKDEPVLLKMDIEGAEEQLLPDCLPVFRKSVAIFVETHRGQESRGRLARALESHGFIVRWLRVREPFADGFAVRS